MNISQVEVSKLSQYGKNSRTHSDEQVSQLAKSIEEFGWTNPILVDADNMVIAGHGRLLAALKLNMATVPCIQLKDMSKAQIRAYVIADNKLGLNSGWNFERLSSELKELEGIFDLSLIGFDRLELSELFDTTVIDNDKKSKTNSPVIQFNIVFDDEDQQKVWFDFVKHIKEIYPEQETLSAALTEFIENYSYSTST
jgi:hypothetical protein